jgi:hypothetical protein
MKAGFEVLKADGTVEEYLHTKVMATISNALAAADECDIDKAQELADVVTYYLYNDNRGPAPGRPSVFLQGQPRQTQKKALGGYKRVVNSNEIFSIIKVTLSAAGFEDAAIALEEHYYRRKIKRARIEVVRVDISDMDDAELFFEDNGQQTASRWDKSRITAYLMNKHRLDRMFARTIASIVEQKVFGLELSRLSASLVKQLVLSETAMMKRAIRRLQM